MSVQAALAPAALQDERERWIEHINGYDPLPKDELSKHSGDILAGMRRALDRRVTCDPPLSTRLDLALRHMQRQVEHRNRSANPCDPDAPKKRNDGIDITREFALMLPAPPCTSDGGFYRALKSIGSFQSAWACKPDELVEAWRTSSIVTPQWSK
jgi:hypothetical protein